MWVSATALALLTGVILHGLAARFDVGLSRETLFLVTGGVSGAALGVWLISRHETGLATVASLLAFAFCSELYIFLFTLTLNSISAGILLQLGSCALTASELEHLCNGRVMVERRLEQMVAAGFIAVHSGDVISVTQKGKKLIRVFSVLRRFFGLDTPCVS